MAMCIPVAEVAQDTLIVIRTGHISHTGIFIREIVNVIHSLIDISQRPFLKTYTIIGLDCSALVATSLHRLYSRDSHWINSSTCRCNYVHK